jgi:hypothetical protein
MAANGIETSATFPGVVAVVGGTFTWGHGETPGVCVLQIAPQPRAPKTIGTLQITYGNVGLKFDRCRVVSSKIRRDSSGQIVEVVIQDWRWEWQDRGYMNCRYNVRNGDGTLVDHWEKAPQSIASEAFKSFGQKTFDVTKLPNQPRPLVDWTMENPARALSTLCESLGCRIAPKFGNGCDVVKIGEGQALPTGQEFPLIEMNQGFDPPEKPGGLMVVGGPAEFQCDFELEAVALEATGEYVPLDDASYKPADGWTTDATIDLDGISEADAQIRQYAKASIYKCYRIKFTDGRVLIPGYTDETGDQVTRMDQLVILDRQCEQVEQLGKKEFLPSMVYGAFRDDDNLYGFSNTLDEAKPIVDLESDLAKTSVYHHGHTIDTERGIVRLSTRCVHVNEETDEIEPAKLRLRIAVSVRDYSTGGVKRHTRERTYPGNNSTTPKILRHEEIVARSIPKYPNQAGLGGSFTKYENTNNVEEIDKEADYYLDIEEQAYQTLYPADATYAGIVPYSPDGTLQHIVWTWGNGGPTTTRLGYNSELVNFITPYKQRRINANVQAVVGNNGIAAQ